MQDTKNTDDGKFVPAEGFDAKTVALKRRLETEVENKVASDYAHIVWAYGIIWSLFAAYGLILWRRQVRMADDVKALGERLASK